MSAAERPVVLPWNGSRYGLAAQRSELDRVARSGRRADWVRASLNLARLAGGGELAWDRAEETCRSLGRRIGRRDREIDRTWRWCRRQGEAQPRTAPTGGRMIRGRSDAVLRTVAWWHLVESDNVVRRSRSGPTVLKLLAGLMLVALRAGKVEVEMSHRQLAEAANVGRQSVMRAIPLMLRHVTIVEQGSRRTGAPTVWRLTVPDHGLALSPPHENAQVGTSPARAAMGNRVGTNLRASTPNLADVSRAFPDRTSRSRPDANAWAQRGAAWVLWRCLDRDVPATAVELAECSGKSVGHVRRLLVQLAGFTPQFAARTPSGWVALDGTEDAVGIDVGAERRSRHRLEQALFRGQLALDVDPVADATNAKGEQRCPSIQP